MMYKKRPDERSSQIQTEVLVSVIGSNAGSRHMGSEKDYRSPVFGGTNQDFFKDEKKDDMKHKESKSKSRHDKAGSNPF